MKTIKSVVEEIESNDSTKQAYIDDPIGFLKSEARKDHPIWDKRVFMVVVYILSAALLLSVICGIISILPIEFNTLNGTKTVVKKEIDNFFVMIASVSIGALAGLLAPPPAQNA